LIRRWSAPALCTASLAGFAARAQAPAQQPNLDIPVTIAPPRSSEVPPPMPPSYTASQSDPVTPVLADPGTSSFFNLGTVQRIFEDPLQYGPFRFLPHLDYRLTYSSDILNGPGNTEESLQHAISPGIAIQSRHILLDYTPSLNYYSKGPYRDHVNHNVSLTSQFGYGDWRFGVTHRTGIGSGALVETAQQTDFQSHTTGLSAGYAFNDRTSIDLSATQQIQDSSEFNSSRTWSSMNWLNYKLTTKTTFGGGVGGGFTDVDLGSDMTFEQLQARFGWTPVEKFDANINGGVEIRQFTGGDSASQRVNPIFGASMNYRPFEYTTLFVRGNRSVNTSLFQSQITENVEASAGINQRFFGKLNASLAGGFRTTKYVTSASTTSFNRSDDISYISTSLSLPVLKKGRISVFYSYNMNDSSLQGYSYNNNQVGLQLGYRF